MMSTNVVLAQRDRLLHTSRIMPSSWLQPALPQPWLAEVIHTA